MATRRSRIKGVANIPPRRKIGEQYSSQNIGHDCYNTNTENASGSVSEESNPVETCNSKQLSINPKSLKHKLQENACESTKEMKKNCSESMDTKGSLPFAPSNALVPDDSFNMAEMSQNISSETSMALEYIYDEKVNKLAEKDTQTYVKNTGSQTVPENSLSKSVTVVKKFLTPLVSASIHKKKNSVSYCEIVENETILKKTVNCSQPDMCSNADPREFQEEVSDTEKEESKKPVTFITTSQLDTEYPPPPPSPNKINRARIKAIPRLSYRKTSFSASESEDENKKSGYRIRNDSICSTVSEVNESAVECVSPQRHREINSIIQKKCNRTEQTRKLAEARREFQKKFGSSKPDKQKLTMMDLIFYNPDSNPMSKTKMKADEVNTEQNCQNQQHNDNKDDGDASLKEPACKSDEENEIPVPQIKISSSGDIIIDEKSLVIERKELKRQQKELEEMKIVDGDYDTGYGIYKKHKRTKNWGTNETLRFYKALNTIGTDFALMCELFPDRNRRELKMKFKKEEKVNRILIDKALMQPCGFDFKELKHELDMEQKEAKEMGRQKENKGIREGHSLLQSESKFKDIRIATGRWKNRKKKSPNDFTKTKEELSANEEYDELKQMMEKQRIIEKQHRSRTLKKRKIVKKNIYSTDDADESDVDSQSEPEEVMLTLKPTRSGRFPKLTPKFITEENYDICSFQKHIPTKTPPVAQNETCVFAKTINTKNECEVNIGPGSIMIVCEKGTHSEPVYKIFMVTPEQNATALSLTPDDLAKVVQGKSELPAKNIMTISTAKTDGEGYVVENNITIPADNTVTTLKSDHASSCDESDALEGNKAIMHGQIVKEESTIVSDDSALANAIPEIPKETSKVFSPFSEK